MSPQANDNVLGGGFRLPGAADPGRGRVRLRRPVRRGRRQRLPSGAECLLDIVANGVNAQVRAAMNNRWAPGPCSPNNWPNYPGHPAWRRTADRCPVHQGRTAVGSQSRHPDPGVRVLLRHRLGQRTHQRARRLRRHQRGPAARDGHHERAELADLGSLRAVRGHRRERHPRRNSLHRLHHRRDRVHRLAGQVAAGRRNPGTLMLRLDKRDHSSDNSIGVPASSGSGKQGRMGSWLRA